MIFRWTYVLGLKSFSTWLGILAFASDWEKLGNFTFTLDHILINSTVSDAQVILVKKSEREIKF